MLNQTHDENLRSGDLFKKMASKMTPSATLWLEIDSAHFIIYIISIFSLIFYMVYMCCFHFCFMFQFPSWNTFAFFVVHF